MRTLNKVMANLTEYKGLQIVATPSGAGGEALTNDLKELADRAGPVYETAGDPTTDHDEADTASVGVEFEQWSKWHNTSDDGIFICVDPSEGAAVWVQVDGTGGGGGLENVVEDLTPQLGGDLDLQTHKIYTSTTDQKIVVEPNGTGAFQLDSDRNARGDNAVDLQMVGTDNTEVASGNYTAIGGGASNMATATAATVPGGYEAKGEHIGGVTHATGYFTQHGDAQTSVLVARCITVGNQVISLELDGNSITIPTNKTITFDITVVARRTDAGREGAGWQLKGVIENDNGDVSLIGSVTKTEIANDNSGTWDINATADVSLPRLNLRATGQTGKTIRWVARIEFTEVYGEGYYA